MKIDIPKKVQNNQTNQKQIDGMKKQQNLQMPKQSFSMKMAI
jgi:hypothetical protein